MSEVPILYSFRRCPYAMRARMALVASGCTVRLREVILKDKPDEMLAASSKETVPVLIDGDVTIDESRAVMDWALARNDPEGWRSCSDTALIDECDGPFKYHLDRYKYSSRYQGADAQSHRTEAMEFIGKLEARLAEMSYLCGKTRGFADIAIFPFVRQFRIADPAWFDDQPIPYVQAWLKNLTDSALFISVMDKYPAWNETGEECLFPK